MNQTTLARKPWQLWLISASLGVFALILWFGPVPSAVGFLAAVLTALGALRLLLTPEQAGILAVRSRMIDVVTLWGGALALVALTIVMPH